MSKPDIGFLATQTAQCARDLKMEYPDAADAVIAQYKAEHYLSPEETVKCKRLILSECGKRGGKKAARKRRSEKEPAKRRAKLRVLKVQLGLI